MSELEDDFVSVIPKCLGPAVDTVELTAWKGKTSARGGKTITHSWPELAADIERYASDVTAKDDQVYFVQGVSPSGNRNNDAMSKMTIVAFDADDVGPWDTLRTTLDYLELAYILYQSNGHGSPREDKQGNVLDGTKVKWRVLIPLAQPFDASSPQARQSWRAVYERARLLFGCAAELHGKGFDPALKTPSQPVYVGCRGSQEAAPREVHWNMGRTLDLHALAAGLTVDEVESADVIGTSDNYPELAYYFQAAGWLGDRHGDKICVRCPKESEHTPYSGPPTERSVILFPRIKLDDEGREIVETLGSFCCGDKNHFLSFAQIKEIMGPEVVAEGERLAKEARDVRKALPSGDAVSKPAPRAAPRVVDVLRSDAFAKPQKTYPTSFPELNTLIAGGLKSRQAFIVAGPTGAGKTGFASCLARDLRRHLPVLFVTTEIDEAEQAARFVAIERECTPDDILAARVPLDVAAEAVKDWPVHIFNLDWAVADGVGEIGKQVEALTEATGQTPAVVVDYLQMIAADDPELRRQSVAAVANKLRVLAQRFDTPVVAVSSVSRAFYGTAKKALDGEEDPRAWLASAKESGDVEYAAAVFAFLDVANDADLQGFRPARLIVAKSRRGQVGFVGLKFHGPSGRFDPDPGAGVVMSGAVKAQERALERAQEDAEKVFALVQKNKGRIQKARLKERAALKGSRFYDALDRLFEAGRLREEEDKAENGRTVAFVVMGIGIN